MPKVSVIMACHNAALFIEYAIASVVNQTFTDIELIIVDDASSDESLLLAQKAAHKHSRISVFSLTENVGQGAARNFAINKAKGEWLAILDADDAFLMNKIERQLQYIGNSGSNVVLIGTNSFEINEKQVRFSMQSYPTRSENLIKNLVRVKRFPPHSSLMYRTMAVQSLKGFDSRYSRAEDYDLLLRLSRHGSFALVPEPLIEYRHHGSNISKTNMGFEQVKYGTAATICHYIRENDQKDPSQFSSVNDWKDFLAWVNKRLEEESLYNYLQIKEHWNSVILQSKNPLFKAGKLTRLTVLQPFFAWQLVLEKIFSNRLPKQLANEWIKNNMQSCYQ